jgi:hypothetical protein
MLKLKNTIKGFFILHILILIAICASIVAIISYGANKINDEINSYKEYLGEKVVIQQDTLEIVDYSLWRSTLTLENGKEINSTYADKKLLKQEVTQ